MNKSSLVGLKTKRNLRFIRSNWWLQSRSCRLKTIECLCSMCHQERLPPPGLTPSKYSRWCDDCFVDLPLWLKFEKTTALELENLIVSNKAAADRIRDKRDSKKESTKLKAKPKAKSKAISKKKSKIPDGQPTLF